MGCCLDLRLTATETGISVVVLHVSYLGGKVSLAKRLTGNSGICQGNIESAQTFSTVSIGLQFPHPNRVEGLGSPALEPGLETLGPPLAISGFPSYRHRRRQRERLVARREEEARQG